MTQDEQTNDGKTAKEMQVAYESALEFSEGIVAHTRYLRGVGWTIEEITRHLEAWTRTLVRAAAAWEEDAK